MFDNDGTLWCEKPIRIWSRTGRRPLLAAGNSNGDIPMLHFTQHHDKPSLRLLVLHDDGEREFAYTSGAEQALDQAATESWTVVSIRNDWTTVLTSNRAARHLRSQLRTRLNAAGEVRLPAIGRLAPLLVAGERCDAGLVPAASPGREGP